MLQSVLTKQSKKESTIFKDIKKNYELYLLSLPVFLYFLIFYYGPMYGVQIAFKDFIASKGIMGSPFVGFEHFNRFFSSYSFWLLLKNTLGISLYSLLVGFPCPIILALMLNEVRHKFFKKTIQMATYAPYFISTVVMVGMIAIFLSPETGMVNKFINLLGMQSVDFLSKPEWFKSVYVLSGLWQTVGWGSIIYIAVLSNIDQQLHEAAVMDGANRLQRIYHIDIPGIIPTAIILLILGAGTIMNVGFEKVFLMQNALNMQASDVITTYVYRVGIKSSEFSFSAAVGLFNSVINFILLISVNFIAKRTSDYSLW